MRFGRFYCERIKGDSVELDQVDSHHLMHVMRLGAGSNVELFDGKGTLAKATVAKASRKRVRVDIDIVKAVEPRTTGRVIIAAAIAKAHRFDLIISKCTELGADCIVPVIFERTVKQPAGSSVVERYKKLSIAAAKQCGRIFLPEIVRPSSLDDSLEYVKGRFPGAKAVFGGFGPDAVSVGSVIDTKYDILAFIGPEGGMTDNEEKKLQDFGAVKVGLTETILRTETASIAFAALLCAARDGYGA